MAPLPQLDILVSICDTWNGDRPPETTGAARTSQCSGDGRAGRKKMNVAPQLLN